MNRYPLERWVVLVPGNLGQVLHRGIHMQGSIARVPLIKSRLCSRWMGVTDTYKWLRVIVNNTLIGHADLVAQ